MPAAALPFLTQRLTRWARTGKDIGFAAPDGVLSDCPCRSGLSAGLDAMNNKTPIEPTLADVREVLRLAFTLLADAQGVDTLLGALQGAAGVTPLDPPFVPEPMWGAANRFVLDALSDGLVTSMLVTLDGPE